MGALLGLSLRQMTGRTRLIIIVLLAAIPIGLAMLLDILVSDEPDFNENFIETIVDRLIVGAIMPIVVMTLATAAFGNELEDHTLNVLVVKPISRMAIVLPKLLGSIIVSGPLIVAVGVAVVLIAVRDGGASAAIAAGIAVAAGVVAYAAIFTWAGLLSTKALGFALVYVFLWEQLVSSFMSGVRYLSVRGYTLGILHGLDKDTYASLERDVIEFPAAIVGASVVTVLFIWLTVRRLQRMDVQ